MITAKKLYKEIISLGLGLALSATLLGCATPARTNTSYISNIPSINKQLTEEKKKEKNLIEIKEPSVYEKQARSLFEKLYQKDTLLAEETGKIPEFQDGISEKDVKTLENIINLYDNRGFSIEDTFKEILSEGKREVRKYCTPLRFLFWIAEDLKTEDLKNLLENYSLEKVYSTVKEKVSSLDNFKEIVDMLSSPKLIDIYERSNFKYEYYIGSRKTDEQVFKSKKANCKDTSEFTAYCLEKAGYKAGLLWVDGQTPEGHIITYFKDDSKIFLIDNGKVKPKGILGPYNSFNDIPYRIRKWL